MVGEDAFERGVGNARGEVGLLEERHELLLQRVFLFVGRGPIMIIPCYFFDSIHAIKVDLFGPCRTVLHAVIMVVEFRLMVISGEGLTDDEC